jgi:phosphate transport system permease protein
MSSATAMRPLRTETPLFVPRLRRRRRVGRVFRYVCLAASLIGAGVLVVLVLAIAHQGWDRLTWSFLSGLPSRFPSRAGIKVAIIGSLYLMGLTTLFAVPLGVGAAVYLEEYARKNWFNRLIQLNIANLAGVPAIVYGLLGLALFVRGLRFDRSLLSAALTMSLLVGPVIIIASREALAAVPESTRLAAYALGATRWQVVRHHVLPAALPGILTGIILALSRALGEAAPLILIGAIGYIAVAPASPLDRFTVLPIQIFSWAEEPHAAFHELAAAAILVLLAMLLSMNALAIGIRNHWQRRNPG